MANFVYNGPCHKCGSRDNLAHYDDGSAWCWGCHHYEPRNKLPSKSEKQEQKDYKSLPDDFGTFFGADSVSWFSAYDFSVDQLIVRKVGYSSQKNQTIFTFPPTGLWVARNHWPNSKLKYFLSGNHDAILPIYFSTASYDPRHSTCVLVEDALSAIKIANTRGQDGPVGDAMPLLGTHLPSSKLIALKRLYETLIVWLDRDKGKEAQQIADKAKMLGMKSRLISTELDPKEYDEREITTQICI